MTTRGRNFGVFNGLGHNFGLLTAHLLYLSALGSDIGILAPFGLAPCRLPSANLPQALRLLAIALKPAPWLVLTPATLAQATSRAVGVLWPSDRALSYPGRRPREVIAPKGKPGGNVSPFSSGVIKTRTRRLPASLSTSRERNKELDGL